MNYLFVVAHPDDETLGAGGMISDLIIKGNNVSICILCTKVAARNVADKNSDIEKQIEQSLKLLGSPETFFGEFPNIKFNTVPHIEIVKFIENAIIKFEPDVLITHYPKDINNDHQITAECCNEAFRIFQRNESYKAISEYLYMEVLSSTDWSFEDSFKPNYFYEIGLFGIDNKIKALSIYEGALRKYPHPRSIENIKALVTYRGSQAKLNYAEAFVSIFRRINK